MLKLKYGNKVTSLQSRQISQEYFVRIQHFAIGPT